jgi:two-component system, OmpR family, response regulator VicR
MRDGKHLILCVDDDTDLLDLLRMQLEKGGYAVETAFSGEEGLVKFKQHRPDLIIVDLMMEEIDAGTNLVKELKLAGNQVPVLLLSSMGDQLNLSTGYRELGLDAVFQKPVNAEALLRTIKAKLAK